MQMGDSDGGFEPVGQHYHAISPDESITSANDLSEARFNNLFECAVVDNLDYLLPPGSSPARLSVPVPDGWAHRVKAALLNAESSENHMNGTLQNALKEAHGFQGLNVEETEKALPQKKKRKNMLFQAIKMSPKRKLKKQNEEVTHLLKVTERQIRNLFSDCYGDGSYNSLVRANGLPVSLTSRPDFAVWVAGGVMMTCEGKHHDNFELSEAIRQCSAYMLVHLYYWLVTKSKLVQSVYGVAVAGTNCKDMRGGAKFAVVLLRLSLPTQIGGKLRLEQYKIAPGAGSLEQLWIFANCVCRTDHLDSAVPRYGQGCPALLQMPSELLEAVPNPNEWAMIRNSTANLVLRINTEEGWNYIGQYLEDGAAEEFERSLPDDGESKYPIYFKSKNFLATDLPGNLGFHLIAIRQPTPELIDIQDAYMVPPYTTAAGLYILMSNMGDPLRSSDSFPRDLRNLASKFLPFLRQVLDCQKTSKLVHGDIHTGNLVYDGEKFHLIDYDEARRSVTRRQPKTPDQKRVYNERLVDDFDQFTKNQLINLFRECWVSLGLATTGNTSSDDDAIITGLMEDYVKAYEEGQSPDAAAVDSIYDRLYAALEEISSKAPIPVSP